MKKIFLADGKSFSLVDDEDFEYLSCKKWRLCGGKKGYAGTGIWIPERKTTTTLLMHRMILNPMPGLIIDHVNGNSLDNRRKNLRIATYSQNGANSKARSEKLFKGIRRNDSKIEKWNARIKVNYKEINLGSFKTIEEALEAYDLAATKYFGNFAHLNK